jgi:hypothetical protein
MQAMEHPVETTANFVAAMGAATTGVSVVTNEGLAGRYAVNVRGFNNKDVAEVFCRAATERQAL